jgi:hypothetical protein
MKSVSNFNNTYYQIYVGLILYKMIRTQDSLIRCANPKFQQH